MARPAARLSLRRGGKGADHVVTLPAPKVETPKNGDAYRAPPPPAEATVTFDPIGAHCTLRLDGVQVPPTRAPEDPIAASSRYGEERAPRVLGMPSKPDKSDDIPLKVSACSALQNGRGYFFAYFVPEFLAEQEEPELRRIVNATEQGRRRGERSQDARVSPARPLVRVSAVAQRSRAQRPPSARYVRFTG